MIKDKRKYLVLKRKKPRRCIYCNKALKNRVKVCDMCGRREKQGYFMIKEMREESGISEK